MEGSVWDRYFAVASEQEKKKTAATTIKIPRTGSSRRSLPWDGTVWAADTPSGGREQSGMAGGRFQAGGQQAEGWPGSVPG
ncbi:hypothetical protein GCM10022293_45140 [Azospirillum formosense]